jgi:hypothetical protein
MAVSRIDTAANHRPLQATPGGYFLEEFSTADAVFTPYVERMNASLYYCAPRSTPLCVPPCSASPLAWHGE